MNGQSMYHRVLIVGTTPFNHNTPSRAFDAYFGQWDRNCLQQVFSNPMKPIKGHCNSLYQITDSQMLKCFLHKSTDSGVIYNYDDLCETDKESVNVNKSSFISFLYRLGAIKTPLNRLLRWYIWKEKYWNNEKFNKWIDKFNPECVFLAFSDDFFINEIAIYIADKYNIPIMCCIGDDYFFNDENKISPLYYIYRSQYKKIIRSVFKHKCSALYISDKIRDKYNHEFGIHGDTIYLSSELERREFRPINKEAPLITYCGNIRLGRNRSLVDIAEVLQRINPNYYVTVYSNESDMAFIKPLKKCKGIRFIGAVPYTEVKKVFNKSDIVIIAEGFSQNDVNLTRYSLSTKAADSITSGCQILTYGARECGVVGYMKSVNCGITCSNKSKLSALIKRLIEDEALQQFYYQRSEQIMTAHHSKIKSNKKTYRLFKTLIEGCYEK